MIQILIHIISYFMAIIMSLFPAKTPIETGPTVIDINGVTYKNCFMPDYGPTPKYASKLSAEGIKPFYVASDGKKYYSVTESILYSPTSVLDTTTEGKEMCYCRESEWESLKAFYYDVKNWNCSFDGTIYDLVDGEYVGVKYDQTIELNDSAQWHQLMDFQYNADRNKNPDYIKLKPVYGQSQEGFFTFRMTSKDDLFYVCSQNFFLYKGEIYVIDLSVGGEYKIVYQVPEDLKLFILEITGI